MDSSVLRDVLGADPTFGDRSRRALQACLGEGPLIACDVVWAEVSSAFDSPREAAKTLAEAQLDLSSLTATAAEAAGATWRTYRAQGGSRERMIADFLIGAHALVQADRLLTRDRGFYRSYFRRLRIVDPSS